MSDNDVYFVGLSDGYDGSYLNSATVTAQYKTTAGVAMGSTATLSYQAGTDGNYKGTIDRAQGPDDMVCGTQYDLWVTIVQGDYDDTRRERDRAKYHGRTP